jgi:hypothetical protein
MQTGIQIAAFLDTRLRWYDKVWMPAFAEIFCGQLI